MPIVVLVTGDRYATFEQWAGVVVSALCTLKPDSRDVRLIHGAQKRLDERLNLYTGIDHIADTMFRAAWPERPVEPFPANWKAYGKGAGPRRNQQMLDRILLLQEHGYHVGVMAFHNDLTNSRGTGGMVKLAEAAGVRVLKYTAA